MQGRRNTFHSFDSTLHLRANKMLDIFRSDKSRRPGLGSVCSSLSRGHFSTSRVLTKQRTRCGTIWHFFPTTLASVLKTLAHACTLQRCVLLLQRKLSSAPPKCLTPAHQCCLLQRQPTHVIIICTVTAPTSLFSSFQCATSLLCHSQACLI